MKKFILVSILAVCSILSLKAQDVILMKDNTIITSIVKEVGDDYIVYKSFDNQSGPDYRVSISKILKIKYQNGTEETFSSSQNSQYIVESIKKSGSGLKLYGRKLNNEEVESLIGTEVYKETYLGASNQIKTANLFLITGLACSIGGAAMTIDASDGMSVMGPVVFMIGCVCLDVCIPIGIIGSSRMKWIASDYNERTARSHSNLTIGSQKHGFGLALNF